MENNCAHALHVLVVEDHEDTAATLGVLLRLNGHNVEVAADGPSALRAAQASPPDVVLLDIGLPKMDGWMVAKQIREQTAWKRPLLVAISGYGTDADQRRSQEMGIDLHLVKPVDPVELGKLLRRFHKIIMPGASEDSADPAAVCLSFQSLSNGDSAATATTLEQPVERA
jgi:two-component system, OmpR family, response regulator